MDTNPLDIMVIIGTRAELIKMFPVMTAVKERGHDLTFIHTGQHDLSTTCDQFEIDRPDMILSEEPDSSSKFDKNVFQAISWNIKLVKRLWQTIRREQPDYILYHGDTMSTALAAGVSSRLMYPIRSFTTGHVEAGLRSGSIREPFPEELARRLADMCSNMLFTVSSTATAHVKWYRRLGKHIIETGNTIVDSVQQALAYGNSHGREESYGIVTIHRHENISSKTRMENILSIIEASPRNLLFPIHDNTRNALQEYGLYDRLLEHEEIELVDLIDYPDFLHLLKDADIIYTDGGSIQEESLVFEVPCVLLRNRTERIDGVKSGMTYLSRFNIDETIEAAKRLVENEKSVENPYGPSGVADRIVDAIEKHASG